MADVEKGKTREEEYVPADYVAPAEADEQVKGGRWSPVCDWPLAFREALEVFEIKSIKEDACCVKFNPLCWLLVALITLINILGKIVHAPAAQARQLRADETALDGARRLRLPPRRAQGRPGLNGIPPSEPRGLSPLVRSRARTHPPSHER